jgi:N-acetyl-alpha-D-muramate 1-phosphate uridylyltransferase
MVQTKYARSTDGRAIMTIGQTAMVLAAGFGTRMRPLTNSTPKPLIKVAGKSIIDYGMDRLREAGVKKAVVNAHYLPDQIVSWSKTILAPEIVISDEQDAILDTGGGIARALPLLGSDPFFVLNSDSFWIDEGKPALQRLRDKWSDKMDCLLLLCDPKKTTGYDGDGDFMIDQDGRLTPQTSNALTYIGGYLVHPRLFEGAPSGKFSMWRMWEKAMAAGTFYGLAHHGHWLHVGTPEAILEAERTLNRI